MSDNVAVQWIYPPNMQDGGWDEKSGNRRVVVRLIGTSDGTGETDVIKVRLSDLKTPNGKVPSRTVIETIDWNVFGLTAVLEWDRAPHAQIARLNEDASDNTGCLDWSKHGGYLDPGGDDGTGNILLTTTNMVDGDNYDITITMRLKD